MSSDTKKQLSGIKGVLFDVDGTLYHQFPVRLVMCCQLLLHLYTPVKLYKMIKIIYSYRKAQEELRHNRNVHANSTSQIDRTVEKTGESHFFVREITEEWFEKKPLPFLKFFRRKGIVPVLDYLQGRDVKLGVYSDYPARAKLQALGLRKYFSTVISASDEEVVGFKPISNGFFIASLKMGLKPEEILYVGDRVAVDGAGAMAAGMKAVILKHPKDAQNENCFCIRSMRELPYVLSSSFSCLAL